uniref:WD_REPEATS_REGION domain-containing protein n=1 Tax=Meloidogyne hapla TaxID=6305 RepID=A0A1I8B8H9_MELHA
MNYSNLTSSKVESRSRNHEKNHFRQPSLEVQGSSSSSITPVKRQRVRLDSNCNGFTNRNGWNNNRSRNATHENGQSLSNLQNQHQKKINYRGQNRTENYFDISTSNNTNIQTRSAELSDLPGYSYDPKSKKYYRILDNVPGQPSGSTLLHLRRLAVNSEVLKYSNTNNSIRKLNNISLPNALAGLQIFGSCRRTNLRLIEESRLRSVKQTPSYSSEVLDSWSQRFDSCQFLDVSEDGKTLLGCWSTQRKDIFSGHNQCSRVLSFKVNSNSEQARRHAQLLDENPKKLYDTNGRFACNTYGLLFENVLRFLNFFRLQFDPLDNGICLETTNQVLVDMVLAPADRDVTCLLFATASSFYNSINDKCPPRIVTKCNVHLRPIEFNLSEEICVGMERNARIFNVLTGQNFFVSSGGRNVISCAFSKFVDSASSDFVHTLCKRPNTLLSENFDGKIKLWDIRTKKELTQMESGHLNSSHKLPCFVDANEQFIFAVGEDSIVRGWSLHTGELLCVVRSPAVHNQIGASNCGSINGVDFPRVTYSNSWGGRAGNSALIFAVNGDLLVHELLL